MGQIVFGTILIVVLVGISGLYGQRQLVLLRRLRQRRDSQSEEDRYLRNQAWRRLVNSILMTLLAVLLVVLMVRLEGPAQDWVDKRDATIAANTFSVIARAQFQQSIGAGPAAYLLGVGDSVVTAPVTAEDRSFAYLYGSFLFVFVLVLFIVLVIAGIDAWATRRYGMQQYRKLMADRRAMIERQAARLREERNGEE
jgi:hypothetical protein